MTTRCLGCLLLASFLAMTGGARAAEPDLRLVTAIQAQDGPAVRALLREGVDVNAVRADGATALLWAAHWDDLDTADLLLAAGADVNVAEDQGGCLFAGWTTGRKAGRLCNGSILDLRTTT